MLSREQSFFLAVLADHLNGRPTAPVSGLDWKTVYDMAERHQVSALFYAQCGAFLPQETELQFMQSYGAAVAGYAARQKIAADIDREFTRHKIPYVIVKGLSVAESYPQPELRTMGDIDFVVKPEDKERAHAVLLELGFNNLQKQDHEWGYTRDAYAIELHHRLLYDEYPNTPPALSLADRMWEYVRPVPDSSRYELDCNFHFLFLLLHLKKHVVVRGAGFRQFMDLAVAVQKWPISWPQTEKLLLETGLLSFAGFGLALGRKWFQLPLPLADTVPDPEFELHVTQQIFSNGVFGFDNEAHEDYHKIALMESRGGDCLSLRLRKCWETLLMFPSGDRFLSVLFPGYEILRKSQTYSFVDQHPRLVPVAWFYRFLHCIWFKVSYPFQIMLFSRKKVRERKQTLEKMGL